MDKEIKNYLGISFIIVGFLFAFGFLSFTSSYSKSIEPSSFRSFSVSGEGKIVSVPDVAQFTFSVITEGGKDIARLQKENTQLANRVIDFVKSKTVDDKDIKTESYNLTPRYQYYSCPRDSEKACPVPPVEIVGYTVSQTVKVKIRDFEKMGDILGGAIQAGANSVSQLSFEIDDPADAQNEARAEAIAKAQSKAESIAKAAGFSLGRILSINEDGYYPQPMFAKTYGVGGAFESESFSPSIEPGSQEITANITITYEIK